MAEPSWTTSLLKFTSNCVGLLCRTAPFNGLLEMTTGGGGSVGVLVIVPVWEGEAVGVSVCVAEAVGVSVSVGVSVTVGVSVSVGVSVTVGVSVIVGVSVMVGVSVTV